MSATTELFLGMLAGFIFVIGYLAGKYAWKKKSNG